MTVGSTTDTRAAATPVRAVGVGGRCRWPPLPFGQPGAMCAGPLRGARPRGRTDGIENWTHRQGCDGGCGAGRDAGAGGAGGDRLRRLRGARTRMSRLRGQRDTRGPGYLIAGRASGFGGFGRCRPGTTAAAGPDSSGSRDWCSLNALSAKGPRLRRNGPHQNDRILSNFLTARFGQTPISFRNLFET